MSDRLTSPGVGGIRATILISSRDRRWHWAWYLSGLQMPTELTMGDDEPTRGEATAQAANHLVAHLTRELLYGHLRHQRVDHLLTWCASLAAEPAPTPEGQEDMFG